MKDEGPELLFRLRGDGKARPDLLADVGAVRLRTSAALALAVENARHARAVAQPFAFALPEPPPPPNVRVYVVRLDGGPDEETPEADGLM